MAGPSVNRTRNFELLSEFLNMAAYDGEVVLGGNYMPASLRPDDAKYLLDGEWLTYSNNSGEELKYLRPIAGTSMLVNHPDEGEPTSRECIYPSFPVYGERGRTDWQALGKVPIIIGPHPYIMDTKVIRDDTFNVGTVVSVHASLAAKYPADGHAYMSCLGAKVKATAFAVGHVIRPYANNGGRGIRVFVSY